MLPAKAINLVIEPTSQKIYVGDETSQKHLSTKYRSVDDTCGNETCVHENLLTKRVSITRVNDRDLRSALKAPITWSF